MSDIALRVESLSKQYRIGQRERYKTLRDTLTDAMYAPFRWLRNPKSGDHLGPQGCLFRGQAGRRGGHPFDRLRTSIGRNGAGKTTLLKILSRITEPTEGYAGTLS